MAGVGPLVTPTPERSTDAEPPLRLPARNRVAARTSPAGGGKLTWIEQCPPAPSVARQSLVSPKSPLFTPPIDTASRLNTPGPGLVSCTVCAALEAPTVTLPKFRPAVDRVGARTWEAIEAPSSVTVS